MITQSRASKLGSNDLISELRAHPRPVVKTMTRKGPVYSFMDSLVVIPSPVVARQIEKGILVPREPSEQTFELSPKWGG